MICFAAVLSNFILTTIAIPGRSFVFNRMQFQRPIRFTKVDCFTVTSVSFINNVVFIFCSYSIFFLRFTKELCKVFSTYGKFILILISSSWKRSVRNYDCNKNEITKHCLEADHNFNWDQKKVIDRESRLIPRKIKETIHSLKNPNHINKICYMLPEIWLPNLR